MLEHHDRELLRYFTRKAGNADTAADLVQEAYARVLTLQDRGTLVCVRHLLNDAGCPTQKAYIESFNGKFRDECLNEQWFETLAQARQEIARWRRACDARQSPEIK